MTDSFWANFANNITAIGALIALIVTLWNSRKVLKNTKDIQQTKEEARSNADHIIETADAAHSAARAAAQAANLAKKVTAKQNIMDDFMDTDNRAWRAYKQHTDFGTLD